jgi:mRNA-degrading endonuclease RelE of RelBE toxin-antitoxin system
LIGDTTFVIVGAVPLTVRLHPETTKELNKIPAQERAAVVTAIEKLKAIGPNPGYPHSSAI